MNNYTIVTGFWNINRENWSHYSRKIDEYLNNGIRMMSLNNNMVIFIEKQYVDFVKNQRSKYPEKTLIIPMELNELFGYKYLNDNKTIMESKKYKQGLKTKTAPECCIPSYNVIMWSKVDLVNIAINMNHFNSSHFVWLDFGVHPHMLHDNYLNKSLLGDNINSEKLRFLCRNTPTPDLLDIKKFYKSHCNYFAGTMFTGGIENLKKLREYFNYEIDDCIKNNVVDCDQSLFTVAYLKHPDDFELYYGDFSDLIKNYPI